MKQNGNTILITGGGSGIGEALAHRFHDRGNTVIIAGRRREAVERAIAGRPGMHALTFDAENAASIADLATQVVAEHPTLNVLVNNAGIMRYEPLDKARDLTDAEATVSTNLLGPIRLIDALIDHLTAQADAAIVNVSSGLAFVPLIASPTYNATKAGIHSYTIALREALRGEVEVIELVPPAVQTELTPGQGSNAMFLPLEAFADEVMELFSITPSPPEILVQRVGFQRFAEAENRFDETLVKLNGLSRRSASSA